MTCMFMFGNFPKRFKDTIREFVSNHCLYLQVTVVQRLCERNKIGIETRLQNNKSFLDPTQHSAI